MAQTNQNYSLQLGTKEIRLRFPNWAEQANGNIVVQTGDTTVLVTATMSLREATQSFFPLTVEYEERFYAAGKILGSRFMRREGRPTEEAVITARLIDRAIRPLFPKALAREVQVIATCLSWDGEHDPDVLSLLGASLALSISDIPWNGPVGVVRVGRINNEFVINPTYEERAQSDLDFVLAGVQEKEEFLYNMIEAESMEVPEQTYEEALQFAKSFLEQQIAFQKEIIAGLAKEKIALPEDKRDNELEQAIQSFLGTKLKDALFQGEKQKRMAAVDALKTELLEHIETTFADHAKTQAAAVYADEEIDRLVHEAAIKEKRRVDDRKPEELRPLHAEAGLLPRTHGSGLFERGQTRTISILTLGSPADHKLLEGMEVSGKKRFLHHYNFPPYAPGEVKPLRGPGRREIGHGALAEKALLPIVPDFEEFPYTIRIVTEVVSSNGSTSMAAVCSSLLALMDAGVPIKKPVAGISMGLMADDQGNYELLTDIQGPEDHHGDMDFKVAGSEEGITAIQLDVKVKGITEEMFRETLKRARAARFTILRDVMFPVLDKPRPQLSKWAPKIQTILINPEKIGLVIGPGGKTINRITEEYGVEIEIEPSGKVYITGDQSEAVQQATTVIRNMTKEVEVGELYQGTVKRIMDFGAFVEILPGQEGLVHISQLAPYRVNKVTDIVKVGDVIPVKVIEIDDQDRINLSLKQAQEEPN